MLKNTLFSILVFCFFVLSSCDYQAKMKVYKPHYLSENSEHRFFRDAQLENKELANITQVLSFYGEEFLIQGDSLMITQELSNDWELVWNYTSKSENADWLNEHKP